MKLIVGSESTWSLRALICAYLADIACEIEVIDLTQSEYKSQIKNYSAVGLVPVLVKDEMAIHDSLAIAEFFNELSSCSLYPTNDRDRAIARSYCCELHSGFSKLREMCPFSTGKVELISNPSEKLIEEITRIEAIFSQASLPFMFGKAGVVDAFYSVLAYRINAYGFHLEGKAGEYQQNLVKWSLLNKAINSIKL